jgi:ABC-2 type transport system ATP-binding protein
VYSGSISIETTNLTKKFKDFVAVSNLSLKVRKGEIFGFLGPNGAGKTTTIRMLLGLFNPTSGAVIVNGVDTRESSLEMRKSLGFLPERVGFYTNLTARQTMEFYCDLKGKPKNEAMPLLQRVGLTDFADKKVGTFSRGMIQLLGIAQSLIGSPELLVLDEPAGGLDPRWIRMVKDSMREAKNRGATVFFSSHILGEVEEICDRVAIINKGILVAEDTISNLRKDLEMKPRLWLQFVQVTEGMVNLVKAIEGIANLQVVDNWIMVECDHELRVTVMNSLQQAGHNFLDIRTEEPSLEDVFLRFTGEAGGGGLQ